MNKNSQVCQGRLEGRSDAGVELSPSYLVWQAFGLVRLPVRLQELGTQRRQLGSVGFETLVLVLFQTFIDLESKLRDG